MKRAGDQGGAEQGKLGDRERAVGQGESHLEDGDDEEGGGGSAISSLYILGSYAL